MYEPLLLCLRTISENRNRKWYSKSKTEAQGLYHQIKRPEFICAFQTALYLFGYTKGMSRSLQGSTLNVVEAYRQIAIVRDQLKHARKNAKAVFSSLFDKAKEMERKLVKKRACSTHLWKADHVE